MATVIGAAVMLGVTACGTASAGTKMGESDNMVPTEIAESEKAVPLSDTAASTDLEKEDDYEQSFKRNSKSGCTWAGLGTCGNKDNNKA